MDIRLEPDEREMAPTIFLQVERPRHKMPAEPGRDNYINESMFYPNGKQTRTQASDRTDNRNKRRRCTLFLVAIGLILTSSVAIPLAFHLLSPEEPINNVLGQVNAELALVRINFTRQMLNKSSVEYNVLSETFQEELTKLYSRSPLKTNYRRCRVNNLTEGSVKVNYDMFFDVLNRRIPSSYQIKDVLYSVDRDTNDTTLGVLGDLRFRIDSIELIDQMTVNKNEIKDNVNGSVIFGVKGDEIIREQETLDVTKYPKDKKNMRGNIKIDLNNIVADKLPDESTTQEYGETMTENTTASRATGMTQILRNYETTRLEKEFSISEKTGAIPASSTRIEIVESDTKSYKNDKYVSTGLSEATTASNFITTSAVKMNTDIPDISHTAKISTQTEDFGKLTYSQIVKTSEPPVTVNTMQTDSVEGVGIATNDSGKQDGETETVRGRLGENTSPTVVPVQSSSIYNDTNMFKNTSETSSDISSFIYGYFTSTVDNNFTTEVNTITYQLNTTIDHLEQIDNESNKQELENNTSVTDVSSEYTNTVPAHIKEISSRHTTPLNFEVYRTSHPSSINETNFVEFDSDDRHENETENTAAAGIFIKYNMSESNSTQLANELNYSSQLEDKIQYTTSSPNNENIRTSMRTNEMNLPLDDTRWTRHWFLTNKTSVTSGFVLDTSSAIDETSTTAFEPFTSESSTNIVPFIITESAKPISSTVNTKPSEGGHKVFTDISVSSPAFFSDDKGETFYDKRKTSVGPFTTAGKMPGPVIDASNKTFEFFPNENSSTLKSITTEPINSESSTNLEPFSSTLSVVLEYFNIDKSTMGRLFTDTRSTTPEVIDDTRSITHEPIHRKSSTSRRHFGAIRNSTNEPFTGYDTSTIESVSDSGLSTLESFISENSPTFGHFTDKESMIPNQFADRSSSTLGSFSDTASTPHESFANITYTSLMPFPDNEGYFNKSRTTKMGPIFTESSTRLNQQWTFTRNTRPSLLSSKGGTTVAQFNDTNKAKESFASKSSDILFRSFNDTGRTIIEHSVVSRNTTHEPLTISSSTVVKSERNATVEFIPGEESIPLRPFADTEDIPFEHFTSESSANLEPFSSKSSAIIEHFTVDNRTAPDSFTYTRSTIEPTAYSKTITHEPINIKGNTSRKHFSAVRNTITGPFTSHDTSTNEFITDSAPSTLDSITNESSPTSVRFTDEESVILEQSTGRSIITLGSFTSTATTPHESFANVNYTNLDSYADNDGYFNENRATASEPIVTESSKSFEQWNDTRNTTHTLFTSKGGTTRGRYNNIWYTGLRPSTSTINTAKEPVTNNGTDILRLFSDPGKTIIDKSIVSRNTTHEPFTMNSSINVKTINTIRNASLEFFPSINSSPLVLFSDTENITIEPFTSENNKQFRLFSGKPNAILERFTTGSSTIWGPFTDTKSTTPKLTADSRHTTHEPININDSKSRKHFSAVRNTTNEAFISYDSSTIESITDTGPSTLESFTSESSPTLGIFADKERMKFEHSVEISSATLGSFTSTASTPNGSVASINYTTFDSFANNNGYFNKSTSTQPNPIVTEGTTNPELWDNAWNKLFNSKGGTSLGQYIDRESTSRRSFTVTTHITPESFVYKSSDIFGPFSDTKRTINEHSNNSRSTPHEPFTLHNSPHVKRLNTKRNRTLEPFPSNNDSTFGQFTDTVSTTSDPFTSGSSTVIANFPFTESTIFEYFARENGTTLFTNMSTAEPFTYKSSTSAESYNNLDRTNLESFDTIRNTSFQHITSNSSASLEKAASTSIRNGTLVPSSDQNYYIPEQSTDTESTIIEKYAHKNTTNLENPTESSSIAFAFKSSVPVAGTEGTAYKPFVKTERNGFEYFSSNRNTTPGTLTDIGDERNIILELFKEEKSKAPEISTNTQHTSNETGVLKTESIFTTHSGMTSATYDAISITAKTLTNDTVYIADDLSISGAAFNIKGGFDDPYGRNAYKDITSGPSSGDTTRKEETIYRSTSVTKPLNFSHFVSTTRPYFEPTVNRENPFNYTANNLGDLLTTTYKPEPFARKGLASDLNEFEIPASFLPNTTLLPEARDHKPTLAADLYVREGIPDSDILSNFKSGLNLTYITNDTISSTTYSPTLEGRVNIISTYLVNLTSTLYNTTDLAAKTNYASTTESTVIPQEMYTPDSPPSLIPIPGNSDDLNNIVSQEIHNSNFVSTTLPSATTDDKSLLFESRVTGNPDNSRAWDNSLNYTYMPQKVDTPHTSLSKNISEYNIKSSSEFEATIAKENDNLLDILSGSKIVDGTQTKAMPVSNPLSNVGKDQSEITATYRDTATYFIYNSFSNHEL